MPLLIEDSQYSKFLPLVLTRPVGSLRIGILTLAEKWEHSLGVKVEVQGQNHLLEEFPFGPTELLINARLIPDDQVVDRIKRLLQGEMLVQSGTLLAIRLQAPASLHSHPYEPPSAHNEVEWSEPVLLINGLTDLFLLNGEAIARDMKLITAARVSQELHTSNTLIGKAENLFIEEGARLMASVINTDAGPVYIGRNAEVMEGSLIRGPFALGESSVVKMGAKIYGPTTVGPFSKVGGEISNSLIFGFTNKAHDGFLGNSVLGEWCNLGAGSNTSNLKNNYSTVRTFSYSEGREKDTGELFCGLVMGDHSKCGINTMFNTGTVVGVSANVFGSQFPPKHIPSFSWGGAEGLSVYELDKALEVAERAMARRGVVFSPGYRRMLETVFQQTAVHRTGIAS